MTTSGAGVAGLLRAVEAVRELSAAAADDLIGHLPDTGDQLIGRMVDDFVEQAVDALRALTTLTSESLRLAGATLGDQVPTDQTQTEPWGVRPGWWR